MGQVYEASIETVSAVSAKTLMYIEVATTVAVLLHYVEVTAAHNDTNEQLEITIQQITTLGTPTATTITPAKLVGGNAVPDSVVKGDVTASEPTYTANTDIGHMGASSLGGWRYDPAGGPKLEMSPNSDWGIRLVTAMGTAKALSVRMIFEEIGG